MTNPEKIYLITIRHSAPQPDNWQKTLSQTSGITLISSIGRHARTKATPENLESALVALGPNAMAEEELPRHI
ncbi:MULTISPECIES: hypothetical protein [unclassified Rhizobium]|uniref:hypothetical protein n=1 Tax=unclassified Rhizobium TaxID=2613769 RepID=UPI00177B2BCF|nr:MULTISPECIES: hypothetical protein [unclassified Rhizobium]MBD8689161.1 hypothetical protein [Rhizobium sp. CFBP 13644]MBD8693293.1 hypothetical protein [Rhizobium sp. CFBP 13717]